MLLVELNQFVKRLTCVSSTLDTIIVLWHTCLTDAMMHAVEELSALVLVERFTASTRRSKIMGDLDRNIPHKSSIHGELEYSLNQGPFAAIFVLKSVMVTELAARGGGGGGCRCLWRDACFLVADFVATYIKDMLHWQIKNNLQSFQLLTFYSPEEYTTQTEELAGSRRPQPAPACIHVHDISS